MAKLLLEISIKSELLDYSIFSGMQFRKPRSNIIELRKETDRRANYENKIHQTFIILVSVSDTEKDVRNRLSTSARCVFVLLAFDRQLHASFCQPVPRIGLQGRLPQRSPTLLTWPASPKRSARCATLHLLQDDSILSFQYQNYVVILTFFGVLQAVSCLWRTPGFWDRPDSTSQSNIFVEVISVACVHALAPAMLHRQRPLSPTLLRIFMA